jgi:glycosyltransferase involved in cell wall biosynthesis
MDGVIMNARVLLVPSNGQRRVAAEINQRLGLETIAPRASIASGSRGHAWEQAVLPLRLRGRPLWSPSTSAPIAYRNQVVTVHDIGFVDVPQYYAPRFAATYRFIVRALAKTARHIVTVSEFSRTRIIDEYRLAADRVTAVPLGVTAPFRRRDVAEIAAVQRPFGLDDVPYLVAFSGADPRKNTAGVLRAWDALGARRGGGKLVLFGRASNAAVFGQAEGRAELTDVIRVGGISDDDLAALYAGSNGLVFPSFYEGFGLPIIEAAASGAPVITSRGGAMEEVAPQGALLVDPSSTGEIAATMCTALEHAPTGAERDFLARGAAQYSWDAAAATYARIFSRTFG